MAKQNIADANILIKLLSQPTYFIEYLTMYHTAIIWLKNMENDNALKYLIAFESLNPWNFMWPKDTNSEIKQGKATQLYNIKSAGIPMLNAILIPRISATIDKTQTAGFLKNWIMRHLASSLAFIWQTKIPMVNSNNLKNGLL